jgi:hypothetical protein
VVQGQFACIEWRVGIVRVPASFVYSGIVGMPGRVGAVGCCALLVGLCMIGRSLYGSRMIMVVVFATLLVGMTILSMHSQCKGAENQKKAIWAKDIHDGVVRNCAAKRGQKYNAILVSSHLRIIFYHSKWGRGQKKCLWAK